jgi:hypothetical protein
MPVKRQFSVVIPNRRGSLARLARTLARNKVNIQAVDIGGTPEYGVVRLIVDDSAAARKALDRAKYDYTTESVVVVSLPDRPGALARLGRAIASKKVNIDYLYGGAAQGSSILVAAVSDPRKANLAARALLRQLRARARRARRARRPAGRRRARRAAGRRAAARRAAGRRTAGRRAAARRRARRR